MTTTATKQTKHTAAYTAVYMPYIKNATPNSIIRCQAKEDRKIEGVNGASVELKAGEWFYLAASDSLGADMYYIVREVSGAKKCSCPARKPCKHEIKVAAKRQASMAVQPVLEPVVVVQEAEQIIAESAQVDEEEADWEKEYEDWKREMGLDGVISRADYVEMFDPNGLIA